VSARAAEYDEQDREFQRCWDEVMVGLDTTFATK
jgi:hypothetical protein